MMWRLAASRQRPLVLALGSAQTIAWGSSYYLPAVLATPIASDIGISPVWVFAAFSLAMIVSAIVGPWSGRWIDRFGGRGMLILSNLLLAAGLTTMATSAGVDTLVAAWVLMGVGMGIGLYESAFATLAGIYRTAARSPITGITLIAGFASTVAWPFSGLLEAEFGWRATCLVWACLHLGIALPLNMLLPAPAAPEALQQPVVFKSHGAQEPLPPRHTMLLLAFVFSAASFSSTAMAAHLPRLLEAAGTTTAVAIAAGALIGPAQVVARLAEHGLMQNFHPLISARIAAAAHPIGVVLLTAVGAPAAYGFTLLHGAGNGVLTIARGTLPLALFGPTGYGLRQGLLTLPSRLLQACAPLIFGYALEISGMHAIWITAGLSALAFCALLALQPSQEPSKISRK